MGNRNVHIARNSADARGCVSPLRKRPTITEYILVCSAYNKQDTMVIHKESALVAIVLAPVLLYNLVYTSVKDVFEYARII